MTPYPRFLTSLAVAATFFNSLHSVHAVKQGFSDDLLDKLRTNALRITRASWEIGTTMQGFLELDHIEASVFGDAPFPLHKLAEDATPIELAKDVQRRHTPGSLQIIDDGAAADPVSIGVGIMLADVALPNSGFRQLIDDQITAITQQTPKGFDGMISHRTEQFQPWSDFLYMVPPTLALYGVYHEDSGIQRDYLRRAYNQIRLYRDHLRDPDTGLWRHIIPLDYGFWATGEGWITAGILRVHQTIAKSAVSSEFTQELKDLIDWTSEVISATWKYQTPEGALKNWIEQDTFIDMAGTALVATATYRLAAITGISDGIPAAHKAFELIKTKVDEHGWLFDTVDPHNPWLPANEASPEGQAFLLMLQAAYRDYMQIVEQPICPARRRHSKRFSHPKRLLEH